MQDTKFGLLPPLEYSETECLNHRLLWEPMRGTKKAQGRGLEEPCLHDTNRSLISKPNNIVLELYSVAFCFSKTALSR